MGTTGTLPTAGFEAIADTIMYRWSAERDLWVSPSEVEQATLECGAGGAAEIFDRPRHAIAPVRRPDRARQVDPLAPAVGVRKRQHDQGRARAVEAVEQRLVHRGRERGVRAAEPPEGRHGRQRAAAVGADL